MTYIPYFSTIVAFVFAVAVFNRYRQRGGIHLLLWAIGLIFYPPLALGDRLNFLRSRHSQRIHS